MNCIAADSEAEAAHHRGVLHRPEFLELAHDVGDGRGLLTDGDVDAFDAGAALVDDRIHRERSLAGLAVADDQLALAATDRDHRIDRLVAGLHWLRNGLPPDHAGRDLFDRGEDLGLDRTAPINGIAERIHHPAEQFRTRRHLEGCARSCAPYRPRGCDRIRRGSPHRPNRARD